MSKLTALAGFAAVVVCAHGAAGAGSTSLAGGTYRVGRESSFGFTDNFDPTGEY